MDSALITLPVPYFILPISIGIIIAFFINRPQMICENGILDRFALIEWSNIKKIKKSNTCENEIIIILQTPIPVSYTHLKVLQEQRTDFPYRAEIFPDHRWFCEAHRRH